MSKLARPGFSKLKPPLFAKPRQSTGIVSPTGGENNHPKSTGAPTTLSQPSTGHGRPPHKLEEAPGPTDQPKLPKPFTKPSTKPNSNRNQQHGTGPYERTTQHTTTSIPYVGKKRPSGVLKSPDSRISLTHKHSTNEIAKTQSEAKSTDAVTLNDPNASSPSRTSSDSGGCGMRPYASKRSSLPQGRSTGCGETSTQSFSQKQTISTGTSSKSTSNLNRYNNNNNSSNTSRSYQKASMGVRPRSSCTNNDIKTNKTDSKRNMSKSLQSLPKALADKNSAPPPMNKPLNKKNLGQKSVSTDNILSSSKTSGLQKPTVGGIPRSKSGLPKFGFSRTVPEKPAACAPCSSNNTVSTPQQSHKEYAPKKIDHQISPIVGTPTAPRAQNHQESRNKKSGKMENQVGIRCKDYETNGCCDNSIESSSNKTGVDDGVCDSGEVLSGGDGDGSIRGRGRGSDFGSDSSGGSGEVSGGGGAGGFPGHGCGSDLGGKISVGAEDDRGGSNQINIIINLEGMSTSEPINAVTTEENEQRGLCDPGVDESLLPSEPVGCSNPSSQVVNRTFHEISDLSTPDVLIECTFDPVNFKNQTSGTSRSATAAGTAGSMLNKTQTIETHHNRTFEKTNTDACDKLNKTRTIDTSDTQHRTEDKDPEEASGIWECQNGIDIVNTTQTFDNSETQDRISRSLDKSKNPNRTLFVKDASLNETHIKSLNETHVKSLNETHIKSLNETHVKSLNETHVKSLNETHVKSLNETHVVTGNDSLGKSDSGFDNTNNFLNMSENSFGACPVFASPMDGEKSSLIYDRDTSMNSDLSEDVLKVIAAISSNINRSSTTHTFSQSPVKAAENLKTPHQSDFIHRLAEEMNTTTNWLDDSAHLTGPALEDTLHMCGSLTQPYDQTDNLLHKSGTNIDMPEDLVEEFVCKNEEDLLVDDEEYNTCPLSVELEASIGCTFEIDDLISKSTMLDLSEVSSTKHLNDLGSEALESNVVSHSDGAGVKEKCRYDSCGDTDELGLHIPEKGSAGSEDNEPLLCDSGHCTDMNDNEVNFVNTNDATNSSFPGDLVLDVKEKAEPSTPPNDSPLSVSPCSSTPLSRQESLEYDISKRHMTGSGGGAAVSRRLKREMRSRTYSTPELATNFRTPKEHKCAETVEGEIVMDKTTYLHFMNEVKLVKTSLLKLKRTLIEAPCASPLKRSISAIERSAQPPPNMRTCQKKCEHKQMELLEEIKLLRSLQENYELKQQDILEENVLLREEISNLTKRLQNSNQCENDVETLCGSVEGIELSAGLNNRLPILQRMYSNDGH